MGAPNGGSVDTDALRDAARRGWPLPVLAAGALLAGAGLAHAILTEPAPDYAPGLRTAATQVNEGAFRDAIETLNARVAPHLDDPAFTDTLRRTYHLLAARSLHGANVALPARQPANDRAVVARYETAADLGGGDLPEADRYRLADALAALDRPRAALEQARALGGEQSETRARIVRRVIETEMDAADPDRDLVLGALERMLGDEALAPGDRVWALATRAEALRRAGDPERAVNGLLRELPQLIGRDAPGLASLYLELGRSYLDLGAVERASASLDRVLESPRVPESDPRRAWAGLYRGRAALIEARDRTGLEEARRRLVGVIERHPDHPARLGALLTLGQTEIELDHAEGAITAFGELLASLRDLPEPPREPSLGEVTTGLLDAFDSTRSRGRTEAALRIAEMATGLHASGDQTPARVLEAAAAAHRDRALSLLGLERPDSAADEAELWRRIRYASLDEATEQEVKGHLIRSASLYRRHAQRFLIDDIARYADSLWRSARLSDRAGDEEAAISAYNEFIESLPSETRRAEAMFRAAQAYQSLGEYRVAASRYRALRDLAQDPGLTAVGDWPARAVVPLARSLVLDPDPANDAEAESLLRRALSGVAGGPDRLEYSEALLQLGRLLHRSGRHAEAVERLGELLERTPDHPEAAVARYTLADSHRRLAGEIAAELEEAERPGRVRTLEAERDGHLEKAMALFERVRTDLGRSRAASLGALERVALRNSTFYLGDCAYDLGDLDAAIAYYSAARAAYPGDPAVLVALIQIVNAYLDKGEVASARTAHQRAQDFYKTLPDDVWDDPSLPLSRQDWERWLDSSARLYEQVRAADADG